jgi:hypothetical protein
MHGQIELYVDIATMWNCLSLDLLFWSQRISCPMCTLIFDYSNQLKDVVEDNAEITIRLIYMLFQSKLTCPGMLDSGLPTLKSHSQFLAKRSCKPTFLTPCAWLDSLQKPSLGLEIQLKSWWDPCPEDRQGKSLLEAKMMRQCMWQILKRSWTMAGDGLTCRSFPGCIVSNRRNCSTVLMFNKIRRLWKVPSFLILSKRHTSSSNSGGCFFS